jgi:hypothetical protein
LIADVQRVPFIQGMGGGAAQLSSCARYRQKPRSGATTGGPERGFACLNETSAAEDHIRSPPPGRR